VTTRRVIIDCDTGVDDALALLLALRSPVFEVLGITCVAGNVTLDKVVPNTLKAVEASGKQVPVFPGSPRPLFAKLQTAEMVHGSDGLGDLGFPAPSLQARSEHAVDFIISTTMEATEPIEWISQGPLTNLALALMREPRLQERVKALTMMAGGITGGNTTPVAEFNVAVDPEAAEVVLRSSIPKTMAPLEPTMGDGGITLEDIQQLQTATTPWATMASRLMSWQLGVFQRFGANQISPPDPVAVAVAIDPSLAEISPHHVAVELHGHLTRGMTVVDRRWFRKFSPDAVPPNVNVVFKVDNTRYRRLYLDTLLGR
jgi:inosine-uridine nucleoside N-ribohydrolase